MMRPQMCILQVLPRLEMGGVERGTVDLVQGLTEAGIQAVVASGGGQLTTDVLEAKGIHVKLPLYTKNPLRILWHGYCLYRVIKKYQVNVVHCRSRAPAWSCWIAARMAKISFVTTIHGAYKTTPGIKKWYNKVMMKADKIIAISHYIESYIQHLSPESMSKTQVIHRGVDIDYFNPEKVDTQRLGALKAQWGLRGDIPVILFPARLTRLKNHAFLIQALKIIRTKQFQCIIVGAGSAGYVQEMTDLINAAHLQEKIRLVGGCNDMPAAYLLANVVVQVADHPEAFGRVVAEAQAMGRPVLAPNKAGPTEIVRHNVTGWLYQPSDQPDFLTYLEKALTLNSVEKTTISEKSRGRIISLFTKDHMVQATIDLYSQLISQKQQI